MRLLFASHRYFPVPGGTERLVQTVAEGAAARGHQVEVVTQREPATAESESIGGVTVRRLKVFHLPGMRLPWGYRTFLHSSGADLFHLFGNRIWCADTYLPWASGYTWPQCLTGLGFYQYAMHPRAWDRWYFESYFPRRAAVFDRYLASTTTEAEQLVRWGFPPERIVHMPLGIALDEFERPPEGVAEMRSRWNLKAPHVAVYAGGFFENKRVDRLVDAVGRTRGEWALVAIGRDIPSSPYSMARVRDQAQRLGVEILLPGVLDRADVLRAFFASDAVLLGSQYEGFGLTLLEAMAAGRPFVSWRAGAADELAATGSGWAVDSVEALAESLGALREESVRRRFGSRGREAVREYSQEVMLRRHLELYESIAESRPRSSPPPVDSPA